MYFYIIIKIYFNIKMALLLLIGEQEKFKRSYKAVFSVTEDEKKEVLSHEGWHKEEVEYSLGDNYCVTQMNVLQIENLTFYRPINPVNKGEFERFFGIGCQCNGFSKDIIRFSYGPVFT